MSEAVTIIFAFLALFVIVLTVKGIRVVPERSVMMIERLGKFSRQLNAGLNLIIPIIDAPRKVPVRTTIRDEAGNKLHLVQMENSLDLREQVYDFPAQQVITRDNVGILVDAVVYFAIMDPRKATYEIANLPLALETLTQTTLRNVIGEMDLDDTLSSRDTINAKLVDTIDQAANGWGVKVNRVEVQDIEPPQDVTQAMEQVMKAERERRANVTEAEGFKRAEVLKAEGERDARIALAEGEQKAQIAEAKGEAEAIREVAAAKGQELAILKEHLGEQGTADYLVALRYMDTLDNMAKNNNVVWMPHSASDLGAMIGGFKKLIEGSAPRTGNADSSE
ncbi:MAG: SPFH domain-containing protein [Halieaceae bacterium]|jgi:regulator of protease activity HflC (stomatin/prohibitin superfamily)|nr:SPFH domain-containing protein [Halieaceae bacterium]